MLIFIKVIHVIVAVFLIMVVLFQTGKGAEMGAAFGGSSQTLFGGGGPAGFMAKLTTAAAVGFMLTSLTLAYLSSNSRITAGNVPVTQTPVQAPVENQEQTQGGETAVPVSPSTAGSSSQAR
jgi:preprotein translocase subunit SecG